MDYLDLSAVAKSARRVAVGLGMINFQANANIPQSNIVDGPDGYGVDYSELPLLDGVRLLWAKRSMEASFPRIKEWRETVEGDRFAEAEAEGHVRWDVHKERLALRSHLSRVAVFAESRGIDTSPLFVGFDAGDPALIDAAVILSRRIWAIATAERIKSGGAEPTKKERRAVMGGSRNRNHEIDNAKARSFLIDYPKDHAGGTATIEKLAEHLECSVGHAQKLPAWKAEMELRAKRPKIQSLSGGEAQGPAEPSEALDDLVKEQAKDKDKYHIRSGERS